jgi:hypothetical protein
MFMEGVTVAMPVEPHIPAFLNSCLRGRRRTYLVSESSILLVYLSQASNAFSLSTDLESFIVLYS